MEQNQIIEKVKSYSTTIGVSELDFKTKLEEQIQLMKENFKDYTEDIIMKKAFLACIGYFKSLNRGTGGKTFNVIFFGTGSMYDQYKKERKEARDKGFMTEDGTPLFFDQRFDWRLNKPIPSEEDDESYSKRLYGVFKLENTETWKPGVLYLSGKNKILNGPEFYKEYIIKASIKDEKLADEQWYMNSITATRFSKVNDNIVPFNKVVESVMPKNLFKDISFLTNDVKTDDLPIGVAITRGTVTKVNLTEDAVKSNVVEIIGLAENISNEDFNNLNPESVEPVTIWVPKDIELNFGIGSDIMVAVQKTTSTDKEGKVINNFNGIGIYVLANTGPENKPKPILNQETTVTPEPVKQEQLTPSTANQFWKPEGSGQ